MKSIALRYSENFAPKDGTIMEHKKLIEKRGYVFWGKLGSRVSEKNRELVLAEKNPRILLIHSGGTQRYWAQIEDIVFDTPGFSDFPEYYHALADKFKTWFKIVKIQDAPKNILSQCYVVSSGVLLGSVSKHSMSPYYVIDYRSDQIDCISDN